MKDRTPVICDRCRAAGYLGEGRFSGMKPLLDFTPVPRKTRRHDGWTPERQRGFIEALARSGSVSHAAMAVNMAKEGAYQLRFHEEAGEFNAAWDKALEFGTCILSDAAMDRAIHGVPVPIFHQGKQVGERRTFNERLTMWQLQHRKPEKYGKAPGKDTRSWKTQQREEWESRDADRKRFIEMLLIHYQNRVHMEQLERDRGHIEAADFYLRQLTHFEILLECAGAGMDIVDIVLGRVNHERPWEWDDAPDLATTPLSEGLLVARLNGWIRCKEGEDLENQAGHEQELQALAEDFASVWEERWDEDDEDDEEEKDDGDGGEDEGNSEEEE